MRPKRKKRSWALSHNTHCYKDCVSLLTNQSLFFLTYLMDVIFLGSKKIYQEAGFLKCQLWLWYVSFFTSLTQFVVLDFDIKYSNCESLLVTARARYRTKKRIEIWAVWTTLQITTSWSRVYYFLKAIYFLKCFPRSLGILSHCVTKERSYFSFLFG